MAGKLACLCQTKPKGICWTWEMLWQSHSWDTNEQDFHSACSDDAQAFYFSTARLAVANCCCGCHFAAFYERHILTQAGRGVDADEAIRVISGGPAGMGEQGRLDALEAGALSGENSLYPRAANRTLPDPACRRGTDLWLLFWYTAGMYATAICCPVAFGYLWPNKQPVHLCKITKNLDI